MIFTKMHKKIPEQFLFGDFDFGNLRFTIKFCNDEGRIDR